MTYRYIFKSWIGATRRPDTTGHDQHEQRIALPSDVPFGTFGRPFRPGRRFLAQGNRDDFGDGPPRRDGDDVGPARRGGRRGGPRMRPPFDESGFGGRWAPAAVGAQGRGRGRRPRGDTNAAVLALLSEEPMHGYQIITELESRSQGRGARARARCTPPSRRLEDQGLVHSVEAEGRKVFELTETGRAAAAQAQGPKPWEQAAAEVGDARHQVGELMRQVGMAGMQVIRAGNDRQVKAGRPSC
ncbi:MAG: PadR family transcriptional regulator [Ilumatobacteraceae bacterium]